MRLISLLLASVLFVTNAPLPVSAEMLKTPEQFRAHRHKNFVTYFDLAKRAYDAGDWERAKNFLEEAERNTNNSDEELNVFAHLADTFKRLGDKRVSEGGEYDNLEYRSALHYVDAALEINPSIAELQQLKASIPRYSNRREQAEAKERWRREDEARRAEKRKREEEASARISNSEKAAATLVGVAAIALGAKVLLRLGAKAAASDGSPAFGGTADGATGNDEFQCELRCVSPARVVVFSVLAHNQSEAVQIAGSHSVEVCHYAASGSSTPYQLEYDKCHRQ